MRPTATPDTLSCHRTAARPRKFSSFASDLRDSSAHPSGPNSHTGDSTATPATVDTASKPAGAAAQKNNGRHHPAGGDELTLSFALVLLFKSVLLVRFTDVESVFSSSSASVLVVVFSESPSFPFKKSLTVFDDDALFASSTEPLQLLTADDANGVSATVVSNSVCVFASSIVLSVVATFNTGTGTSVLMTSPLPTFSETGSPASVAPGGTVTLTSGAVSASDFNTSTASLFCFVSRVSSALPRFAWVPSKATALIDCSRTTSSVTLPVIGFCSGTAA
mmetsp:Transcript_5837/g.22098  ORF Transcript_5837/g.22098 Transcript_5837/m.22098 type:complete len:278 (+) Transcript_5837:1104-1937(+)